MSEALALIDRSHPGIAIVTLNRPDKRNALNIPLLEAFCAALDDVIARPDDRVIVITGAGPVFCAGLDLAEARDPHRAHRSADLVGRALRTLMEAPKPTIAAVRGAAVAGGAGIMLACDLAVVADDFKTGFPEVRRGLVAGLVMTFVRRKTSERMARELLLLGELIDARKALEADLVARVVPADRVLDEALALARAAMKGAPGAIAMTKSLFDELWRLPVGEHLARAHELHKTMRSTPEAAEGLAAFEEKRLPSWDPDAKRS